MHSDLFAQLEKNDMYPSLRKAQKSMEWEGDDHEAFDTVYKVTKVSNRKRRKEIKRRRHHGV